MSPAFVAHHAVLAVPHDTNLQPFEAFRADAAGTVSFTTLKDVNLTLNVSAGEIVPIKGARIRNTGTTVTVHLLYRVP